MLVKVDYSVEIPMSFDEFYEKFIDFLEDNNCYGGGGMSLINEDGEVVDK